MAKIKIQIPTNLLNRAYPESVQLRYLPRKRKKKLKKEKQILGFRWNYSLTSKEWRLGRLKKL